MSTVGGRGGRTARTWRGSSGGSSTGGCRTSSSGATRRRRSGGGRCRCSSSPTSCSGSTPSTCASGASRKNLGVAVVRRSPSPSSTWVVANILRRRPPFDRPHDIGPAELAVFVVVPAIPSLVVGQWGDALQTFLYAVGVLALLWFVTSYGVPTLLGWAWQRTKAQLTLLLSVLARALPLLLLFSTFLFINAECWQVAGTLTGPVYVAVLGVFFVLGATFVLTRIPPLMRSLNTFASWGEVAELTRDTPAADVLDELHPDIARRPPRRAPVGAPARQHRAADRVLAGDPGHARRPRPGRVLRPVRLPRHPRGDGGVVDRARRRPRAGSTSTSAGARSSSPTRCCASPASSARSGRCTSPCCCRPTPCTARSSRTTSPRSCAKLWPCDACTGPRGRRA